MNNSKINPNANKANEAFKRYNDFRSVKVNSDRIDFDLKCEDLENLININQRYYNEMDSFHFNIFEFSNEVGRNM